MPDESRRQPRPTTNWERRLIRSAGRGDAVAQSRLLALYEPMVRRIARRLFLPGGDRDDLAQEARVGVIDAARVWNPRRGVPFSSFAYLCAVREVRMAISAARAQKHQVLSTAYRLEWKPLPWDDDAPEECERPELLALVAARDTDPVAKLLAREQLAGVLARTGALSELERRALGLAASDWTHREIADTLDVHVRGVNNALQRARHKLTEPLAA